MRKIAISFCEFNNGTYDFYLEIPGMARGCQLSGSTADLSDKAKELLREIAPPCVMTKYVEV